MPWPQQGLLRRFETEAYNVAVCATVFCVPFEIGLPTLFENEACAAVMCAHDAWLPFETGTKVSAQADPMTCALTVIFVTDAWVLRENESLMSWVTPASCVGATPTRPAHTIFPTHPPVKLGAGFTVLFCVTRWVAPPGYSGVLRCYGS